MQRQHHSAPSRKLTQARTLSRTSGHKQAFERLKQFDPVRARQERVEVNSTSGDGPFVNYARQLTPEGGILITYRDLDLRLRYRIARILAWTAATGCEAWLFINHSAVNGWLILLWLVALGALNWWVVKKPPEISRSIEIRPDRMIVDGRDEFRLDQMRDTRPAFEPEEDEGQVLCGIYGNRFVEYTTAYRVDEFDRTPDILAVHLKDAMEQLWGREEIVFDPLARD